MGERSVEVVELERIRRDAMRVVIRLGLGSYDLQGPGRNVLIPESHVAWATVVNELGNEGYRLVTPMEWAAAWGGDESGVLAKVYEEGSLFALSFGEMIVVPLPEKEAVLQEIEV